MVEKKNVTIAILCIATIIFLGLWVNAAQELGALREDYNRLEKEKQGIMEKKTQLLEDYTALKSEYDSLKDDILGLTNTLSLYQDNYRTLKEDYDKLHSILEEGEAIAESAEWVSEDERLKATSKLIPEYFFGGISGYTVQVTITNVGDEPLDQVWIFLFPYVEGKLYEYWNPLGYAHNVENIYIGETYSHDFTYLPKDMTSYRVLVVAG